MRCSVAHSKNLLHTYTHVTICNRFVVVEDPCPQSIVAATPSSGNGMELDEIHEQSKSKLLRLGAATRLASMQSSGFDANSDVHGFLWPAIQLGQIVFHVDELRGIVGFASWAFFSPQSLAEFCESPHKPPVLQDWNDGVHACIVNFVSPFGYRYSLARRLRNALQPTHSHIFYLSPVNREMKAIAIRSTSSGR